MPKIINEDKSCKEALCQLSRAASSLALAGLLVSIVWRWVK